MITGMKKYAKTEPLTHQVAFAFFLSVTRRFFLAPKSDKRMEWWGIPQGNPIKVAATEDGMYRRA